MALNSSSPLVPRHIWTTNTWSLEKSYAENLLVGTDCHLPEVFYSHWPLHTVRQIENYPTANGDVPTEPIVIAKAGLLAPDDPSLTAAPESQDGDAYEDFPDDEDRDMSKPETALEIAKAVREIGNKLFKEGQYDGALAKYQSMYRSSRSAASMCAS